MDEEENKKDSATVRAVKEIRRETVERLRSGEDVSSANVAGGEEGRLVIHREMDLKDPPESLNAGALIALPGKTEPNPAGRTVRPGGILVERNENTSIPTPKWHSPSPLTWDGSEALHLIRQTQCLPRGEGIEL